MPEPKEMYGWGDYTPGNYHRWRWRAVGIWALLLSLIVIFALAKFRHDSVRLSQLETTNCNLKTTLLKSRNARIVAAHLEKGAKKRVDLRTADGLQSIAVKIVAVGNCSLPGRPVFIETNPKKN